MTKIFEVNVDDKGEIVLKYDIALEQIISEEEFTNLSLKYKIDEMVIEIAEKLNDKMEDM